MASALLFAVIISTKAGGNENVVTQVTATLNSSTKCTFDLCKPEQIISAVDPHFSRFKDLSLEPSLLHRLKPLRITPSDLYIPRPSGCPFEAPEVYLATKAPSSPEASVDSQASTSPSFPNRSKAARRLRNTTA